MGSLTIIIGNLYNIIKVFFNSRGVRGSLPRKEGRLMDLRGKSAVVTGGAMGIGLATSKRLVREGCSVTIWDLNAAALEDAKKELEAIGGKVFIHVCDVTDKKRVY
jgi:2-keto-3-deoxy-L-fuconate dehydrogenase